MKALLVANWKMNPASIAAAKKLLAGTKKAVNGSRGVSVVVAPPSIFVRELAQLTRRGRVSIGVQNAHFLENGSYTGEISVPQIKDAKATHVIIGHAERRLMGETNEEVRKKVAAVVNAHLTPIICVGESVREPSGEHFHFIRTQIEAGLADVPPGKIGKVIIAYEPVWAIGASKAMSPSDMHGMSIFIRKTIVEKFGELGHSVPILYGGAIDSTNAAQMMQEGDVKGLLIGRASTDAQGFSELIRLVASL